MQDDKSCNGQVGQLVYSSSVKHCCLRRQVQLQVSFNGHYAAIQSQSPPACREDSEYEEKAHPGENGDRLEFQCVM